MNKHLSVLIALLTFGSFGAFGNIEALKKVPEINEYFCEFEKFSFNLNWDENVYNTKAIITIDVSENFKFDASDKLLGQFGLGEIIFRRLNNQLERHDFFFSQGAYHEGDFIRGFFISGVNRKEISTLYVATYGEGEARLTSTGSPEVDKGNCKFLKVQKD